MEKYINGHRIYLETHGDPQGRPLVLLHHGLGAVASWSAQFPFLVEHGFFVVVYDRWGYGRSDPRERLDLPTFDEDTADLAGILDELGLEYVTLVGHSDGGTLALYFTAWHPERVERLVVIAAHIYVEASMERGISTVGKAFAEEEKFRTGLRRLHGDKTRQVFENWFNGWMNIEELDWDMRAILGRIVRPVLVVQGDADEHASPRHACDLAAAISGAELWLAPGMRHMLPQENAPQFNVRLLRFLNGVPDGSHPG